MVAQDAVQVTEICIQMMPKPSDMIPGESCCECTHRTLQWVAVVAGLDEAVDA